jgi:arginase
MRYDTVPDQGRVGNSFTGVSILGACVNEGQNWYTGVEEAPRYLRHAGIVKVLEALGYAVDDVGDVRPTADNGAEGTVSDLYYNAGVIRNAASLGRSCKGIFEAVKTEAARGRFVLTLGGDHSVAAGTISAIKTVKKDVAVVWVDAHADCNIPETSSSGNFHGMPVGMLLGWFKKKAHPEFDWIDTYLLNPLPENRLAFIGLRDVDEGEKRLLRQSNILLYSMMDVERLGIAKIMEEIVEKLSPNGCRPIHLSFDIDGMDPHLAPGTGTRARGGLTYREGRYICSRLAETGRLESMDLVEVNPSLDHVEGSARPEHGDNELVPAGTSITVKLGIELVEFALGKTLV